MLFQFEQFLGWFPRSAAWLLIMGGALALTWLGYERKRRGGFIRFKNEDWEQTDVSKVLRVISYLGLVLGVLMIWAALVGILNNIPPSFKYAEMSHIEGVVNYDLLTSVSLLVIGVVCFLKPINDLPWSGIFGIFSAIISGVMISFTLADLDGLSTIFQPESVKWVSIITGVVASILIGVIIKFTIGSLQLISKILSHPTIALFVAAYCILQGVFLLVWGFSMGNYGLYLANLP